MRYALALLVAALLVGAAAPAVHAQRPRKPLRPQDVDDIATLLRLEDTRQFDAAALTRIAGSPHPEVSRRAIVTIGRIADDRGRALLEALRTLPDTDRLASVAFATGQLKDATAVPWLGGLLASSRTPADVARESAQALGKIGTRDARAALASYLSAARESAATAPVIGEALLSIGRFASTAEHRDDLAPIVKWTTARDVNERWRAAWALFRPRDPRAVSALLTLSTDPSAEVRFWSLRGLAADVVTASGITPADAAMRLRQGLNDPDRRARTEALRALVGYDDAASVAAVVAALASDDTWLSVSAADPALARHSTSAESIVPALVSAAAETRPLALRISALAPLVTLAPDTARALATVLLKTSNATAQGAAQQALRQLDAAERAAIGGAQPAGRGGNAGGAGRPALTPRADADYRTLVTRWIVPDYEGEARPHVVIGTTRGDIEIELFPGDAPFGVEYLLSVIASDEIVNTEFGRVVPNFVAQQRAIRASGTLRDEVNRHGLLRGTLSWASSGLDTGRPGYTLASTPQPHNEGNFTALGQIVSGLDVVDHLELGDRITSARTKK